MPHISAEQDVTSGGEIKNCLSRREIFLEVLDRHPAVHDDIAIRKKSQSSGFAQIIGGNLNISFHRDVAGIGSTTRSVNREIHSTIEHALDRASQRGINGNVRGIEEEMTTRPELELCQEIVKVYGFSGGLNIASCARIAGGIDLAVEIGMAIRPNDYVSALARIRAGIKHRAFKNGSAGGSRSAARSHISTTNLDPSALPCCITGGDWAGHFNASAIRMNFSTLARRHFSGLLDRGSEGITR